MYVREKKSACKIGLKEWRKEMAVRCIPEDDSSLWAILARLRTDATLGKYLAATTRR